MHLTTVRTTTRRATATMSPVAPRGRHTKLCHPRVRHAGARFPVERATVFRIGAANLLEMPSGDFHNCVIGQNVSDVSAAEYAGRRILNHELSASKSEVAAPGAKAGRVPVPPLMHKEVTSDASTPAVRSWSRTGGRKNNAENGGFAHAIPVNVTIANIRMMRIGENIPATQAQFATVAPILHGKVLASRSDRGTTLSNGAAA
ncbi:MAG TPA: hypothetical protein VGC09_21720 [Rhodopila sp.]